MTWPQPVFEELTATAGQTWAQLLKRPEVTVEPILRRHARGPGSRSAARRAFGPSDHSPIERAAIRNEARAVETEIKFAGYLDQQKKSIEKLKAAEAVAIPEWLEYGTISGLSREMREKLERIRPAPSARPAAFPASPQRR